MSGQGQVKGKIEVFFTFWALGLVRRTAKGSNSSKVLINVYERCFMSTKAILRNVEVRSQKVTIK